LYLPPRMQAVGRHSSPARHGCDEQQQKKYECLPNHALFYSLQRLFYHHLHLHVGLLREDLDNDLG
jgi:hypothetical protein